MRGVGLAGAELSRLHDQAELLGKLAVVTLAAVVALSLGAAPIGVFHGATY